MKMRTGQRGKLGAAITETAAGLIILIPVVLFLLDVAAMVLVQTENDKLAKAVTRAAATDPNGALSAQAMSVYNAEKDSALLTKKGVAQHGMGGNTGMCSYQTTMQCNLPVPIPFINVANVTFQAFSTEPIVGQLPTGAS